MNIFGFHIEKKSKYEKQQEDLRVFRNCVCMLEAHSRHFKDIKNHVNISFETFQELTLYVETLGALIDIYNSSPFAMPSKVFNLVKMHDDCKLACSTIGDLVRSKELWHKQMNQYIQMSEDVDSDNDMIYKMGEDLELQKKFIIHKMVEVMESLESFINIISFEIRYDLMRINCDADILAQYKYNKKLKKVPETEFAICFKKLSDHEINMQKK